MADESRKFRFDPSLSWGDLSIALTLALSGVLAFFQLSARVSVTEIKLVEGAARTAAVADDLRAHKIDSAQADSQIRSEVRDSLRDIGGKLDRLIERELDGARNGH